ELPRLENIQLNSTSIVFAILAAAFTGLVFGLAPAWQARATGLNSALRAGGRSDVSDGMPRLRPTLIVFEVALALVLLIGAGLLIRSFAELQSVDPGFRVDQTLSF